MLSMNTVICNTGLLKEDSNSLALPSKCMLVVPEKERHNWYLPAEPNWKGREFEWLGVNAPLLQTSNCICEALQRYVKKTHLLICTMFWFGFQRWVQFFYMCNLLIGAINQRHWWKVYRGIIWHSINPKIFKRSSMNSWICQKERFHKINLKYKMLQYIYEKDYVCAHYNGGQTVPKRYLLCYMRIVLWMEQCNFYDTIKKGCH